MANTKIYDNAERRRSALRKQEFEQARNQLKADITNRSLGIRKKGQSSLLDLLDDKDQT